MGFQQRKGPMASMGCIRVRVLTWDQIAINEVLALVHIKGMTLIKVKALLWVQQTTIRKAMDSLGTIKDLSILRIFVGHSIQIGTLNHTLVTNTRAIVAFLLIRARDHNLVCKGSQSGFSGQSSNSGFKNGSTWQSWNGNTNFRSSITPKCQICFRIGHTTLNCHFRSSYGSNVIQYQLLVCQICGKKGHAALDCYHRNNYTYQGAPPPPSTITAMSTQGSYGFTQQRDDS